LAQVPIDSYLSFDKTATSAFFLGRDGTQKSTNQEEFHRRFDSGELQYEYWRARGEKSIVLRQMGYWRTTRYVAMVRRGLLADYQRAGLVPTAQDAFNFSMWRGYESEPGMKEMLDWFQAGGAEIAYIHTSGLAS
jgi:hypothetical protein